MVRLKGTLFILTGLLLIGCSMNLKQPSNKIETYTLEYDPPVIAGIRPFPFVIAIERFSVVPLYNTTQMIYRDQAFKRDAYVYHRWRVNPGDLVTSFLRRDLKHSGLFKAVLSPDSSLKPSFILEGSVDEWVEWDTEVDSKAALTLDITFIGADVPDIDKRVLFQKSYGSTQACRGKTPRAFAESMSLAMSQVSEEIIRDIRDYLVKKY